MREESHDISAGVSPEGRLVGVLTGAKVDIYVKGRRLKTATSFTLQADAGSIVIARVSYLDMDESGRIKQVQFGSELINKKNDFEAFVVRVEPVGKRIQFHVMPKSFIASKANDFTLDDEKFLLEEILRACEPLPPAPPAESL